MPAMWENFVSEIGAPPGIGAVTLAGANPDIPCMTFLTAGYTTGAWVYYIITDGAAGGMSEEVQGQFNATTGTLSRAVTIRTNAGGTTPLNFTGTVKVFAFPPASRMAYFDNNLNLGIQNDIILLNAKVIYWKDSVGTNRSVLQLNGNNDVNIYVAGGAGRKVRILNQTGLTELFGVDNSGNMNLLGNLALSGNLTATSGQIGAGQGYLGKVGVSGSYDGHIFNISWPGSGGAHLYIDNTDFGAISTVSDRRIKHMIADNADGALARIMALRPVTYHFANVGIFTDTGTSYAGFIADEVQSVVPSAVYGEPDAVQFDGVTPQPQSLNAIPLIAELTSAVQELKAIVDAQAARIAALENA